MLYSTESRPQLYCTLQLLVVLAYFDVLDPELRTLCSLICVFFFDKTTGGELILHLNDILMIGSQIAIWLQIHLQIFDGAKSTKR